jgi:hypothetical protein
MQPLGLSLICLFIPLTLFAQEFPKGWIYGLEVQQGLKTTFDSKPDLFAATAGAQIQYAIWPSRMRIGGAISGVMTDKKVGYLVGPRLAILLTAGPQMLGSSLLNVHLQAEHLWGSWNTRLTGGGPAIEIGQRLTISGKVFYDYKGSSWWFLGGLGYTFSKPEKDAPITF